ncbi:asparagine synthase (glutamine-hydrolyzing) [Anaerosporobacter faecicola]|uniref:asparagine synthase (glutamine-hydrolyzing) n=1 Tax=Anaerosporobacter faecicola TaxID=2718714 RepID=UPI00143A5ABB|nr:asparagine synthase (glutamine-hydrolyzing) [Anaerosporobacter faecicola]
MCSISGIINSKLSLTQKENLLHKMMNTLWYRGPDSKGMYNDTNCTMGSTRLKIIGINNGDQPIYSERMDIVLVCNGEVLNYKELKRELVKLGHIFRTDTDVEVFIHLYEEYSDRFLEKVNGQFALALYDKNKNVVILARDRTGISPLFYYYHNNHFYFASEIKALFELDIPRELSFQSVYESLCLWSVPYPYTVFKDIYQVIPGELITIKIDDDKSLQVNKTKYWELNFNTKFDGTFQDAKVEMRQLLIDSVDRAMTADVPVGMYLSGGVDSTIIASIITKVLGRKIDTFSVAFEEKSIDESAYQSLIVKDIGSNHHSITCYNQDLARMYPNMVKHAETILFKCAPIPLQVLSSLVKENTIKTVLSGEGADELFWGYHIFRELKLRLLWAKDPESDTIPSLYRNNFLDEKSYEQFKAFQRKHLKQNNNVFYSHLTRWETNKSVTEFLSCEHLETLTSLSYTDRLYEVLPKEYKSFNPYERAQCLEMITLLNGYLLSSQGDRMLMSNSVEGRFPYLDKKIMDFANSLPEKYKCNGFKDKYILREAFKDIIPDKIYQRDKYAYRAPGFKIFYQGNKIEDYVHEMMSEHVTKEVGIFDPMKVKVLHEKGLKKKFETVTDVEDMAINCIISTHLLYDMYNKKNERTLIREERVS